MNKMLPWLLTLLLGGCSGAGRLDFSLVIFHTNDRHSHFLGLPNGDYSGQPGDGTVGGMPRWVKLIEQERQAGKDVLLLDAGDFTMGTMLVSAEDNAADLNVMKEIGYAAAALGNHEFDWGEQRLAEMILAAREPRLPLLASNLVFSAELSGDDALEALYGPPGQEGAIIHPYLVVTTASGVKVGLLGLLGLNAAEVSNAKTMGFSRTIEELAATAQEMTDMLRREHGVDLVVALAHLGVDDISEPAGESVDLARLTSGIDLIISGHTHTLTEHPLRVISEVDPSWTTIIQEAGSYGQVLGRIAVSRSGGEITIEGQNLPIGDDLEADPNLTTRIEELIGDIETNLLGQLPRRPQAGAFLSGDFHQVLSHSSSTLLRRSYETGNLGYLVADAMRQACSSDMAFASNGADLRQSLPLTGDNAFDLQDTFIVSPLGTGPDGRLGYPLVRFYLRLSEIQLLLEATICDRGLNDNDYVINPSGLRAVIDTSRAGTFACVERIYHYQQLDESDVGTLLFDRNSGFAMDKNMLVPVCTSWYIADQMTRFNVYPKDQAGNTLDLAEAVVKDGPLEVKTWYALAKRLAENDPLPNWYLDDAAANPRGPYWRRVWDIHTHPCQGHPYCTF